MTERMLGLTFAGSATERRAEMSAFLRDVLGLPEVDTAGAAADMFALPDGSRFAVASPGDLGTTYRTLGFLVADLDGTARTLRDAGIDVGEPGENEEMRYAHFRAPDGHIYELVERRS
ncbi:MAG: glyoxylase family protein [Gaiellales bacterium]|nr:glyoxylase family protein [Gaiellales bacterium]